MNEPKAFKRMLNANEVVAAIGEWLHRRGHRPTSLAYSVQTDPSQKEPDNFCIVIEVTDVPADPNIFYNVVKLGDDTSGKKGKLPW